MTAYVFRKNGECGRLSLQKLPDGMTLHQAEERLVEDLNHVLITHKDNPFTKAIIWEQTIHTEGAEQSLAYSC